MIDDQIKISSRELDQVTRKTRRFFKSQDHGKSQSFEIYIPVRIVDHWIFPGMGIGVVVPLHYELSFLDCLLCCYRRQYTKKRKEKTKTLTDSQSRIDLLVGLPKMGKIISRVVHVSRERDILRCTINDKSSRF